MSDKYNVYRAYAAFCQRMSRESQGDDRKLTWLQLAADWLALIRDSSRDDSKADFRTNGVARTGSTEEQHPPSVTAVAGEKLPVPMESAPDR